MAFATAAIWAVHPLSTEAVTNIVGRADLLAALAVLGGFLLYLKSRDANGVRRAAWLAGVMVHRRRRTLLEGKRRRPRAGDRVVRAVWWARGRSASALVGGVGLTPVLLLILVAAVERSSVHRCRRVPVHGRSDRRRRLLGGPTDRRQGDGTVFVVARLARETVERLLVRAGAALRTGPRSVVACVAVGLIAALAIASVQRRRRAAFFFAAFAFVTFVPASNLLFPTGTIMAERLLYLPSIGRRGGSRHRVVRCRARVRHPTLAGRRHRPDRRSLSARTWTRNPDWQNDMTLWTSAVQVRRRAPRRTARWRKRSTIRTRRTELDRVIAEAERSVRAVSAFAGCWNAYPDYRQAGAYYLDKADGLMAPRPVKRMLASDEVARVTERSLRAAQRASRLSDCQRRDSLVRAVACRGAHVQRCWRRPARSRRIGPALDAATRARHSIR